VFTDIHQPQSYSSGVFVDSVLQKEISVAQIFR